MSRTSRSEWARRVERWQESGLTAKEFAAELGVKASTLSYWKWKLKSDHERKTGSDLREWEVAGRSARTRMPAFVEVSAMRVSSSSPTPLELVLRDGVCVRVPPDFDELTLTRLVRALEVSR